MSIGLKAFRRRRKVWPTWLAGTAVCAVSIGCADAASDERARQIEAANYLMKGTAEHAVDARRICATGQAPTVVAKARALGSRGVPDASDDCPVALARVAQDGGLLILYGALLSELSGDASLTSTLPGAIGAAVTKGGSATVAIGNQRAAQITPALALDAGFTVAHQQGARYAANMPDLTTLRHIAEQCLAQNERNLGLCFSTGFVYGARAVSRLPLLQQ